MNSRMYYLELNVIKTVFEMIMYCCLNQFINWSWVMFLTETVLRLFLFLYYQFELRLNWVIEMIMCMNQFLRLNQQISICLNQCSSTETELMFESVFNELICAAMFNVHWTEIALCMQVLIAVCSKSVHVLCILFNVHWTSVWTDHQ